MQKGKYAALDESNMGLGWNKCEKKHGSITKCYGYLYLIGSSYLHRKENILISSISFCYLIFCRY